MDPDGDAKDVDELRLLRLLKARLNGQLDDVLAELGDPPDLNNLSPEFWDTEAGKLIAVIRPELERMTMTGIASAAAAVPVLWDEAVIAREAAEWAGRYVYDLVTGLDANTLALLRTVVSRFVQTSGMTIGQLRSELIPAFGERRAQMIAVTETTRAYAEGKRKVQEELQRGGIHMTRIWRTAMDERVCPICGEGALEGTPESEWGREGPPAHPNCRCWTVLSRLPD
ncbi:MAG: phage head morphogenesis protein [Dehalococcoidia bacterium]|jgi:SPP1 gp7 family putative phage head morphogenesis protein|nr:phage head morphogenesis protein [Dehalococcoidia bacterium]